MAIEVIKLGKSYLNTIDDINKNFKALQEATGADVTTIREDVNTLKTTVGEHTEKIKANEAAASSNAQKITAEETARGNADAELETKILANTSSINSNKTAAEEALAAAKKELQGNIDAKADDATVQAALANKADKATTIAGYGITDAKIEGGVITLGEQTITPLTEHQSLANYYQKAETYSQSEVDSKLSDLKAGVMVVVDGTELPETGDAGKIYLLKNGSAEDKNIFTEYVFVNNAWEKLGEQTLDLKPFLKIADAENTYLKKTDNAAAAEKLTTENVGSENQPVYFKGGVPVVAAHTVAKDVPADAVFTDTTYEVATAEKDGLMSLADKKKIDGLHAVATSGSFADLENKPVIEATVAENSENAVQSKAVAGELKKKADLDSPSFTGAVKINGVAAATVTDVTNAKDEAIAAAKTESDKKDTIKVINLLSNGWTETGDKTGVYTQSVSAVGMYPVGLVCDSTGTSRLVDVSKASADANIIITSMEQFDGYVVVSTRHDA